MMTAGVARMVDGDETISAREALLAAARRLTEIISNVDSGDPDGEMVIACLGDSASNLRSAAEALT